MSKKRSWKKIIGRGFLLLLLIGIIWLINLIWFKPFNIRHFYDRVFVEYALQDPEVVTQLGLSLIHI